MGREVAAFEGHSGDDWNYQTAAVLASKGPKQVVCLSDLQLMMRKSMSRPVSPTFSSTLPTTSKMTISASVLAASTDLYVRSGSLHSST